MDGWTELSGLVIYHLKLNCCKGLFLKILKFMENAAGIVFFQKIEKI